MSAVLELPRHRFDRSQFERMVDAGVFSPEDRLELLDGEIIDMAPQRGCLASVCSTTSGTASGSSRKVPR